jgi:hypothetical protein
MDVPVAIPDQQKSGAVPDRYQLSSRWERFFSSFRSFMEIIRDYGMPTVTFGTGIYAFILLLQTGVNPLVKAGVALALTLAGLLSQLWVYSRENPRIQNHEVTDQLQRMTTLVEYILRDRGNKSDSDRR